jgi:putative oxidoreductase
MPVSALARYHDVGLFALRLFAGVLFFEHGLSKLSGFPHSPLPQPAVLSLVWWAGAVELIAGLLITLGFATRIAALVASGEMAIAYFLIHAPVGFFPIGNKGELAILYCFIFLYFAIVGGGAWSLDATLKRKNGNAA